MRQHGVYMLEGFPSYLTLAHGDAELQAFTRLLEAADNVLWDWVSGAGEPADAELGALVQRLRSVRIVA